MNSAKSRVLLTIVVESPSLVPESWGFNGAKPMSVLEDGEGAQDVEQGLARSPQGIETSLEKSQTMTLGYDVI